tara:strand:+ start:2575 stop:3153 length:579 start_codon:yes stop_codon:yes gene_type:complete
MIDFNFVNNNKLDSGSILVSEPFLLDDYFSRSVIFLCDHNADGSFGFVLNKYVDTKISDFVDGFPELDTKISVGGPVDMSNLFYIHTFGEQVKGSVKTSRELFMGGDFNDVKRILTEDNSAVKNIRFFIGYSGWDKGQLAAELDTKSWIVLNKVSKETILDSSNEDIWKDIMENLGGKFELMSKFPINPSDN